MTPPRVVTRGRAAAGACPSSGPAGPPSPKGEGKGCCWRQRKPPRGVGDAAPYGLPGEWAAAGGRGGVGAPRPTDGDMETLWGLRGHPFPSRRAVGAGHARPGGLRGHPSMVRSVGRGLDPSAGVGGSGSLRGWLPVDGCWREVSRSVGDAAPYGLPGKGRQREPAPHPALRGHLPPRGKARVVGGSGRSRRGGGTPPYGWGYGNARVVYADTRSRAAAR